jgi:hypothetical protein
MRPLHSAALDHERNVTRLDVVLQGAQTHAQHRGGLANGHQLFSGGYGRYVEAERRGVIDIDCPNHPFNIRTRPRARCAAVLGGCEGRLVIRAPMSAGGIG